MSRFVWRLIIGVVAWGMALKTTLSISLWPGHWGHGICGPWGCGPPLQALVSCHLSWIVALLPSAVVSGWWLRPRELIWLGINVIFLGIACLLGYVIFDVSTWWPEASDLQRRFIWQRIGFAIATQIDMPLIELIFTGFCLLSLGFIREKSALQQRIAKSITGGDNCAEIRV